MDTDRIDRIVVHEKLADEAGRSAEEHRWRAAELIWDELNSGTPARALARQIDKSDTHVRSMARTWERKLKLADNRPFNEIYNSDEVRGRGTGTPRVTREANAGWEPPASGKAVRRSPQREDEEDDEPRSMAGRLAEAAYEALSALATHEQAWSFLTDDDVSLLEEIPSLAEKILSGRKG